MAVLLTLLWDLVNRHVRRSAPQDCQLFGLPGVPPSEQDTGESWRLGHQHISDVEKPGQGG